MEKATNKEREPRDIQKTKKKVWRQPILKRTDINRSTKTFFFDPDLTPPAP